MSGRRAADPGGVGTVTTRVVGTVEVRFERLEPRRHDWGHGGGPTRERRLYRVGVDGSDVGLAVMPNGVGRLTYSMEPEGGDVSGFHRDHVDPVRYARDVGPPHDLDSLAVVVAFLRHDLDHRGLPRLFTRAEAEASVVAEAERRRADAERDARRTEEARRARDERLARERQARDDLVAGLRSIDERFGGRLTNLERAALVSAIERAGR